MKPFHFKQFTIHQDRCPMKIGTDGVLLGAWATVTPQPETVLDIGTGSGIIALQLAQRTNANTIDAIEIDGDAFEQAVDNFEHSPWNDRLFCYHISLKAFAQEMNEKYDLIISNPPFYTEDTRAKDPGKRRAKFSTSLPFELLVNSATKLLSPKGIFATIIPHKEELGFMTMAKASGLHLIRSCHVQGTSASPIKRSLIEFSFEPKDPVRESLIIETSRHQYTAEYKALVQDFYLNM